MEPMQPPPKRSIPEKIRALREQGHSVEEIAASLDEAGQHGYAAELRKSAQDSGRNFGLQMAEGAAAGIGRVAGAAGGTLVQKLSGDDRDLSEIYAQLKADADNQSAAYREGNAGKALAANVIGGVVTAKANPLSLVRNAPATGGTVNRLLQGAANLAQPASRATMGGRAINSSIVGAGTGAVTEFLNKDGTLGERANAAKSGALWGAGLGAVLSPVIDAGAGAVSSGYKALPRSWRNFVESTTNAMATFGRNKAADAAGAVANIVDDAPRAAGTAVATRQPAALQQSTTANARGSQRPNAALARVRNKVAQVARDAEQDLRPEVAGPRLTPGAQRLFGRMDAYKIRPEGLSERIKNSDGPDIAAEILGEKGIDDLTGAYMTGNNPDPIVRSLQTRNANENGRLQRIVERETGATAQDAETLFRQGKEEAQRVTGPLWDEVRDLPANPKKVRSVVREIQRMEADGVPVWDDARKLGGLPERYVVEAENGKAILRDDLTLGQLRQIRIALDKKAKYGSSGMGQASADGIGLDRIKSLRTLVDKAIKDAGGNAEARLAVEAADGITASQRQGAKAFALGEDAMANSDDAMRRLIEDSGDPEMFRQGRASGLIKELQGKRNGQAGPVQNPATVLVGNDEVERNARAAFPTPQNYENTARSAVRAAERLKTSQRVYGGSPTTSRGVILADAMAGPPNPGQVVEETAAAIANPAGAAARGLGALFNPIKRRVLGEEMDDYARLLLAGAPAYRDADQNIVQNMSKEDFNAMVKRLYPIMEAQWAQQILRRNVATNAARDRR